jgi:transcriptional regulator GlxA family with amidase domain
MNLSVWLVLTPNVLMLDYAGPAEALRMARDMGGTIDLHVCGPTTEMPTSLPTHLSGVEPLPAVLPQNSLVLVAGNSNEVEDYATEDAQQVVLWLKTVVRDEPRIASICSGALLLAKAGLLAGRRCTTHHTLIDDLREADPTALVEADRVFVDDGLVLTSAGITTGIDLALHIIEQHAGAELAARVSRRLVMYQRRGAHDPQISPWLAHRNHMHPAVHRAQDAISKDPAHPWTVQELAAAACVSPRHLSRIFPAYAGVGVVAYQQQLRIAKAKEVLVRQPQWPMDQVAEHCGFGSARDFRRVWQRFEAEPPTALRKQR